MDTDAIKIPLSRITRVSSLNPRAAHPADAQIPALAASLAATGGPVQRVVVRQIEDEAADEPRYEVLIGRRRYLAMQLVQQSCPPIEIEVDCFDGEDAEAELFSLAEQTQREQLHPADEVRAFAGLAARGFAPAEIARDFGCEERTVRQRLALGALDDKILAAWRDGSITRESAEAFCATPDRARQVALFEHAPQHRRNPTEIRRRLRGDAVRADHGLAKFVGLDAYRAAGGRLDEDLFAADAWCLDGDKLRTLAEAKLDKLGAAIQKREGWQWVRTQFDTTPRARYRPAEDAHEDLTDGETQRLDEIAAELVTLKSGDPAALALVGEAEQITSKAWTRGVKAARRKKLGLWVEIDHDGALMIERGLEAKPDPVVAEAQADERETRTAPKPLLSKKDREAMAARAAAMEIFDKAVEGALVRTIAEHPALTLPLALAGLTCTGWGNVTGMESTVDVTCIADPLHRTLRGQAFATALMRALGAGEAERVACLADCVIAALRSDGLEDEDRIALARFLVAAGHGQEFGARLREAFDARAYRDALPEAERAALNTLPEDFLPEEARALGLIGDEVAA